MSKYVPTIGLEIHAQLKTQTKMFCDSLNDPNESHPNVNVCPVCMGHPGTLPVPNEEAIKKIITVGLALNSKIAQHSKFDRKNYFYPDIPKGYQISQYDMPFCEGGHIQVEDKNIEIERVHLEEDTGRTLHSEDGKHTFVDFNRAGVPLMELVTKPVIESADEARKFAKELQLILRYLDASDADMEKGQMRVEVNLSLSKSRGRTTSAKGAEGSDPSALGTKVELKNLNSLRVVGDATAYEIERQTELLENGKKVVQETRGWDEVKQKTFSQRTKETASDYRYFPEPDIPPLVINKENGWDIEKMKASLPELPASKRERFKKQYNLSDEDAEVFVGEPNLASFYENSVSEVTRWAKDLGDAGDEQKLTKLTTNYIVKNLRTLLADTQTPVNELKITAENFGELIALINKGEVSSSAAREVLEEMFKTGDDPSNIIDKKGLKQVSDTGELEKVIEQVISANQKAADDYKNGDDAAIKFLVGQVMKETKGSANPQVATELLKQKLK